MSIATLNDNVKLSEEHVQLIPILCNKIISTCKIVITATDYKEFFYELQTQNANVYVIYINLKSEVKGLFVTQRIYRVQHNDLVALYKELNDLGFIKPTILNNGFFDFYNSYKRSFHKMAT